MKKAFFVLFLLPVQLVFGQTTDYSKVPLNNSAECKAAEPAVLAAVNFILSRPVDDAACTEPQRFVIRWMEKTEYSFPINSNIWPVAKKKQNIHLYSIYMACMAKFALENPDKAGEGRTMNIYAFSTLADFISKPGSNVIITPAVQELLDAKKNGTIEQFVDKK